MNAHLSEKEAIFRVAKIFIGQYLSSIRTSFTTQTTSNPSKKRLWISWQSSSSEVQTIRDLVIKGLALRVKGILNLQGRTIPNALHLLVVAHQTGSYDFEEILQFLIKSKEIKFDVKSLDTVESKLFLRGRAGQNNIAKRYRICQ